MNSQTVTPSNSKSTGKAQQQALTFYFGVGLYVLSFFLPAVKNWQDTNSVSGWRCAFIALWGWVVLPDPHMTSSLVAGLRLSVFAGLINPIVVVYAVLRILHRAAKIRQSLVVAVLICVPLTWISLYIFCEADQFCPYVGHAVWIVGLVLMIIRDIQELTAVIRRRRES